MQLKPATHAASTPDKPAVIFPSTGEVVTYAQMEARSLELARLFAARGLSAGDHIAILLPNTPTYHVVAWAALRSGLYFTPVNWHLTLDEAAYIVDDCDARVLVTSEDVGELAASVISASPKLDFSLSVRGSVDGAEPLTEAVAAQPLPELGDEQEGSWMFYSSGTTGRPKGIKHALSGAPFGTGTSLDQMIQMLYGFSSDTVYLCPAPLYHAAPLGWSLGTQRLGGTVVLMDRFDPAEALRLIAEYRVTHMQVVPTMFIRMLKLPDEVRQAADVSSLEKVVHAAAPCPIEVKEQMIEWWGPIIDEYYAGSEGNGFFAISANEWLERRGSVGKPMVGEVHILDEDGNELPPGEVGTVWFAGTSSFEYHKDQEKTASAFNELGWSTLGDLGYVDEDGYLYLSDRRSHLIISGGVNIYPQEIENALVLHPEVVDVGVVGLPDDEMGERVVAVVQLAESASPGPEIEAALNAHCRDRLAGFKCPREYRFVDELPRLPTGKLNKNHVLQALAAGS